MNTQITHQDQYKMLREEIMQSVQQIYRTEIAAAVSTAGIYTWLLLHKQDVSSRLVWFVAPCIVFACGLRILDLTFRIRGIAKYLTRIEEAAFGQDSKLPGWENYKRSSHKIDRTSGIIAGIGWFLGFAGSILASLLLSQ